MPVTLSLRSKKHIIWFLRNANVTWATSFQARIWELLPIQDLLSRTSPSGERKILFLKPLK